MPRVDPLLVGGLLLTVAAIIGSMIIDGNSMSALLSPSALLLVLAGSIGASLMGTDLGDLKRVPGAMRVALKGKPADSEDSVASLLACAEVARREGVLALEQRLDGIEDDFVRDGLQLVVDGIDGTQIRERLEINLDALTERHGSAQQFFKSLGGFAPTIGMIGTVIGLVNMLQSLEDPAQLGLGMALALLTTLYGVLFANLLFVPFATKLERLHQLELRAREVCCEGILAVQAGASPRVLVERLEGFLPPERRLGYEERMAVVKAQTPAASASVEAAA